MNLNMVWPFRPFSLQASRWRLLIFPTHSVMERVEL